MADLMFYTNPQSRGRTVRWMLEEVGEPYEARLRPPAFNRPIVSLPQRPHRCHTCDLS